MMTASMNRRLGIALTIVGLGAIPIPFIPFALDYVPLAEMEWRWSTFPHFTLVLPCTVLPPLISIGYIVRHLTGRLPAWTPAAGYLLAAVSASAFLAGLFNELEVTKPFDLFLVGLFLVAFAGAAWLVFRGATRDSPLRGLLMMQCVYVTLMVFAIATATFWGDLQIGGWLGVTAVLAYFSQIAAAVKQYRLLLVFVIPLALIGWVFSVT